MPINLIIKIKSKNWYFRKWVILCLKLSGLSNPIIIRIGWATGARLYQELTRKSPQLNPWELRWNNLLVLDLLQYHASKYFLSKDFLFTLMLSGFEMMQP